MLSKFSGVAILAIGLVQTAPFQIDTDHLPLPIAGQSYIAPLKAEGGTPPYTWSILRPNLPDGLLLDPTTGVISGQLRPPRPFSVLVQVSDSSQPPLVETRLLSASAGAPLDLEWPQPPSISDHTLAGSVKVANHAGSDISLTVIVVAVNQVGKAFALRYDHEPLAPGQSTAELSFTTSLPPGQYAVQFDAVGEVAASGAIYRDRKSISGLVVAER